MQISYFYHPEYSKEEISEELKKVFDIDLVKNGSKPKCDKLLIHITDRHTENIRKHIKEYCTVIAFISNRELRRKSIWKNIGDFDGYILEKQPRTVWKNHIGKIVVAKQRKINTRSELESFVASNKKIELLMRINQSISEQRSLPELFSEIMERSKDLMEAEASSLLVYDEIENKLNFNVAKGSKGAMIKQFSVNIGQGIAGWVAENKEPVFIEDCYDDARFDSSYDKKTNFRTRAMICVPLLKNNKLVGVLQVINKRNKGIFSVDDLTLLETMASQCAIAIDNARLTQMDLEKKVLEQELDTARQIQEKVLPEHLPDIKNIDLAAKLIPAKQVGGDYYHIFKLDEEHSLWVVADVSGKGVPAALIVSTLHSSIQTYMNLDRDELNLLALVETANKVLIDNTTPDKYATAWFGLYHAHENKLESINAGHNPPILFHEDSDEPTELEVGGIFLGAYPLPYEKETIQMKKNDVLVFFTDGVTEAWNSREEDYDDWRLHRIVREFREKNARMILSAIENDVDMHVDGAPQSDDFTCIVVKHGE